MTPERLRRERTAAVLLALVAGLLGLLAASRTWAAADVTDALAGRLQLRLSGRQVAPVVPAVSVVLLAAGAAVLLARRLGRALAGLVLVLAGAVCAAAALSAARTPGTAVAAEVARATGRSAGPQVTVSTTGWPWLAVAAGVVAVIAGVLVVVGGRRWSAPSDRFESPAAVGDGTTPGAPGAGVPAGPPGSSAPAQAPAVPARQGSHSAQATTTDGAADDASGVRAGSERLASSSGDGPRPSRDGSSNASGPEPADAWDALTRGEDPTR